ncbi:cytochrome P450 [Streptomyces sp. NPDC051940]|uniref:cytochrome P450 n=1 Tax=Streptomyces sp. NPDC051940 TaxID=3155675 RepID=UPI00342E4240
MTATDDISGRTVDRRSVISVLRRLHSPEGQFDPFPLYEELRGMGDVVPAPWGGYLVTGYDACSQILRDTGTWLVPDIPWQDRQPDPERWQSPATREMSRTLSRLNGDAHTAERRSVGNPFDRRTLGAMLARIDGHVADILDDLDSQLRRNGTADFVTAVSEQLPVRVSGDWLGIPAKDREYLVDLTHRQAHATELLPTKRELAVSADATLELRAYFTDLIRRRRARPGDDVVTKLIAYWAAQYPDDRTSADEHVYILTMFLTVASLETTQTLLSVLLRHLTEEPSRWVWLRAHPEHIDDAVEEALRFDPAIHINSRYAAEDTVLCGVPIARDTVIHGLFAAANHDPRVNADPDRFDIVRKGSHLTFGSGAHYCMGAPLARLEARSLLAQLLGRFPGLRQVAPPTYARRMVFRRMTSLELTA